MMSVFGKNMADFDRWRIQYGYKLDEHVVPILLKNH